MSILPKNIIFLFLGYRHTYMSVTFVRVIIVLSQMKRCLLLNSGFSINQNLLKKDHTVQTKSSADSVV